MTFDETINALTTNDFNIIGLGSLVPIIGGGNDTYTITINGLNTFDGTLNLNLNSSITDLNNNPISIRAPNTNENIFTFNRLPVISRLTRETNVRPGTDDDAMNTGLLTWNIRFSEIVRNFEAKQT